MLLKIFAALGVLLSSFISFAQNPYPKNPVVPSTTEERIQAIKQRQQLHSESNFTGVPAANIGPTIMSGRVVHVAVNPKNSKHFFVAYATGGVWQTKNNGQSFLPVFDKNGYTIHCGAIAVDWITKKLYVGTGEANSSRSSYSGYGLLVCDFSVNKDSSWNHWQHIGLEEVHHIAKIVLHPTQPDIIYVAAMSSLFSSGPNGGLYKTVDNGKSWNTVYSLGDAISAVDVELLPNHPDTIILSLWDRARRGWDFTEGGGNSGVYRSGNGGLNWDNTALPIAKENTGRIGISLGQDNVLYALVDNQEQYTDEEKEKHEGLTKNSFEKMTSDSFLALDDSTLNAFLQKKLPKTYTAKKLKKMSKKGDFEPIDVYNYLYDSNAAMFEDPVKGAELYRSEDLGKTWKKTHEKILKNICYSYGYYFGVVHASPSDKEHVFIAGVPLLQSLDGGQTFTFSGGDNVHVDHHYIWVNPKDPLHLINGNDGGINISYDGGETWAKCNSPAVGQFYTVAVDNDKPYNVYGGLQDNGTWKGPNNYKYARQWHQEGRYAYQRVGGGDGMQIQVDPRDNTLYTGSQYGNYRYKDAQGKNHYIHPKHLLKEAKLRWNWQTPILLSTHDPDVLYIGSNRLHKSTEQYKNFRTLSEDLTNGAKKGNVSYGTLACIAESPLKEGILYTGSDDGLIHLSPNGGKTWIRISDSLPQHLWVTEVLASKYAENTVYAALSGYTWDHFNSYLYVSANNGATWSKIGKNLPAEPINTVVEDPTNDHILYLGTDAGLYISTNRGQDFYPLGDIPPVAVHDLAIQETKKDLVVATHGRSIYKIKLQHVYDANKYRDSSLTILPIATIPLAKNWGDLSYRWKTYSPELDLAFYSKNSGVVTLTLSDTEGNKILTKEMNASKGYNATQMKLEFDKNPSDLLNKGTLGKYYPVAGKYTVILEQKDQQAKQSFLVK